jgi:D-glycero-D-manno-heptose 1,7-bisphosphate phosphatase
MPADQTEELARERLAEAGIWTAFLDRDGTINQKAPNGGYVLDPAQLQLLPGAGAAIRRLNDASWRVVVVTNQRGIARGLMTDEDLRRVHERLAELLGEDGARIDRIYYCPHEDGTCDCRKPGTGLLERARSENPEIAFERAVFIGDSQIDVDAGRAAGIKTVAVGFASGAYHYSADLSGAVDWALSEAEATATPSAQVRG